MTQSISEYSESFFGKTVLITGASYGIGECFARELAREQTHLILTARSREKLDQLAAELQTSCGIKVQVIEADLSLPEEPRRLYEEIQSLGLHVDILINNAGYGRAGRFENVEAEADNSLIMVNVNALAALTHLFIPKMLERKGGGVMNIASTAAFQPLPFLTMYAASKAFVLHFTEALWKEYQHRGVRIFCLCPGNTVTEFHNKAGIPPRRVFFSAKPRDVVRFGLKMYSETNRPLGVYGFINNLLGIGYRILPRRVLLGITGRLYPKEIRQSAS